MQYNKSIIVLKEFLDGFSISNKKSGGIARLETENNVSVFHLSLININQTFLLDFVLFLYLNNELITIPLNGKSTLTKTLDINYDQKGFSMAVCHLDNNMPKIVLFGGDEKSSLSVLDMNNILQKSTNNSLFNDEVVATENYFEFDNDIDNKLKRIGDWDKRNNVDENFATINPFKEASQKSREIDDFLKDEETSSNSQDLPYFQKVKDELMQLFSKFPEEKCLSDNILDSKFVRINFSADKYYVVGLVKVDGVEKYICYGVPSDYSTQPPKEFEGFCSFVPASIFDLKGKGYWMMFQDAQNGKCIKKEMPT